MVKILKVFLLFFTVHYLLFTVSFAAHPLITDDTGTQGRGKFQLEFSGEYGHDKENGITAEVTELSATLTYGITDSTDIAIGIPYQYIKTEDFGTIAKQSGLSDISLSMKWRFYEEDGLSLALKPGITLPTGDEERGLGAGKMTYGIFFITTKAIEPWAFHLNLGYIRNENNIDERKYIWHASVASEANIIEDLKVVANIGIERNPDRTSNTHPAFILGGIIYSIMENLDFDIGIKGGLNKSETDYSVLAGITLKF